MKPPAHPPQTQIHLLAPKTVHRKEKPAPALEVHGSARPSSRLRSTLAPPFSLPETAAGTEGRSARLVDGARVSRLPRRPSDGMPVTSSDAGGKGIRTLEEAIKYEYADDFNTVGYV